ncbi:SOUL heme-binding family protein [Wolffia australiana]
MATAWISGGVLRPLAAASDAASSEKRSSLRVRFPCARRRNSSKVCAVRSDVGEPIQKREDSEKVDVDEFVRFLYDDLPHLFDDQGIDPSRYDDKVEFRDPITRHDSIQGYLFNINFLRLLFQPDFKLHGVKQTGPLEVTTRWTMRMNFALLPWKPELVFTGLSIMSINPETRKFSSHVDIWDSIQNNDYFSFEGLLDFFKQLRYYKTPELQTPRYEILKRTKDYEIRRYEPFLVVESKSDRLSGSGGFNDVTGYIFGKNTSSEKIPMTTPVFTQTRGDGLSDVSIQIVLPLDRELDRLPSPNVPSITIRKVDQGVLAVSKFSGKATDEIVAREEKELRAALLRDGLIPQKACLFARYNDPGRTWSFILRNEVLIQLEGFTLE